MNLSLPSIAVAPEALNPHMGRRRQHGPRTACADRLSCPRVVVAVAPLHHDRRQLYDRLAKDVAQMKADIGNDIVGRRVVADARGGIAQIKATLIEFRERIDRLEFNEDGRKHA